MLNTLQFKLARKAIYCSQCAIAFSLLFILSAATAPQAFAVDDHDVLASTNEGDTHAKASGLTVKPLQEKLPVQEAAKEQVGVSTEYSGGDDASSSPATLALRADQSAKQQSGLQQVSSMLGSLLVVLITILVLAWVARRFTSVGLSSGEPIKIVSVCRLDRRERLLVVEVGDQKLLLSTGNAGTQLLAELDRSTTDNKFDKNDNVTGMSTVDSMADRISRFSFR